MGAPVVQKGKIIAILSYSQGTDYLGIYTKISDVVDFINYVVDNGKQPSEAVGPPNGLFGIIKALTDFIFDRIRDIIAIFL